MSAVNYVHANDTYSLQGAQAALKALWRDGVPTSLLDVGAGTGTWLRAALDLGVREVHGIDGVLAPTETLHVPRELLTQLDLTRRLALDRRYEVALCLEVGEHLPETAADTLVRSLCDVADTVFFSAACPGQPGQHHVNLQWLSYWQHYFNVCGFACSETPRWTLWSLPDVKPWYKQNIMVARRDAAGGTEPRIRAVVHPEMLLHLQEGALQGAREDTLRDVRNGTLPLSYYVHMPVEAGLNKARRALRRFITRRWS